MRRSAAMKKQVKAMQSMDERMARIEAALGITDEDPTPSPSPQEQGGEQEAGDSVPNGDDVSDDAEPEADEE